MGPARLPEQFYGLKDFGGLEDYVKARIAEFRKNILGTDLLEPGFWLKRLNFKSKDDFSERGHKRVRGGIKGRGKPKRRGGKRWRRAGPRNLQKKNVKRKKGRAVDIAHVPEAPNETFSREENEKGKSSNDQRQRT